MPGDDDILIEFQQAGAWVKVIAIDPTSGREVSIVGNANAPRDHLAQIAARKLRGQEQASPATPPAPPRRGIIV